ncbi:MAG: hypothetical protein ABIJ59_14920 [Pseudomonadota bacterium]
MDQYDIRLIGVVLFLIFGSFFIALFRKLKNKIIKPTAPTFTVTFDFKNQDSIILENQIIIIPEHVIQGAIAIYDDIQTIPEIQSKNLVMLEEKFRNDQENKKFAQAAIQTFRAWNSGIMLKIIDPDKRLPRRARQLIVPAITPASYRDFVLYNFLGVQNADLMPETLNKLQQQYAVFFNDYTLDENEFLLAWAQRSILTNRHLIIFSTDDEPKIDKCVPLLDIQNVTQTRVGIEKLG